MTLLCINKKRVANFDETNTYFSPDVCTTIARRRSHYVSVRKAESSSRCTFSLVCQWVEPNKPLKDCIRREVDDWMVGSAGKPKFQDVAPCINSAWTNVTNGIIENTWMHIGLKDCPPCIPSRAPPINMDAQVDSDFSSNNELVPDKESMLLCLLQRGVGSGVAYGVRVRNLLMGKCPHYFELLPIIGGRASAMP